MPGPRDVTRGGMIKFQRLARTYPHRPYDFNLLYLGSSSLPRDWRQLERLARRRRAPILFNQDGVAYPGWHGPGWEEANRPAARLHRAADFVFYQSRFCVESADRFLGERSGPSRILHNAVDTTFFTPAAQPRNQRALTLLLGGNQYQLYRLESALRALAILRARGESIRLLVAGRLNWIRDEAKAHAEGVALIDGLGVTDAVELTGPFSQVEAPDLYRRADLLLHTKYNDPCPSTVIEAMACGLPVVYSASGGTPELVGEEAGVGVPAALDWERDVPSDPGALADAVLRAADRREALAEAARQRAVDHFDLEDWVGVHREVIETLLSGGSR